MCANVTLTKTFRIVAHCRTEPQFQQHGTGHDNMGDPDTWQPYVTVSPFLRQRISIRAQISYLRRRLPSQTRRIRNRLSEICRLDILCVQFQRGFPSTISCCKRIAVTASSFGLVFMSTPKTMLTGLVRPRHHAVSLLAECLSGVRASTFTESCATEEMARASVAI